MKGLFCAFGCILFASGGVASQQLCDDLTGNLVPYCGLDSSSDAAQWYFYAENWGWVVDPESGGSVQLDGEYNEYEYWDAGARTPAFWVTPSSTATVSISFKIITVSEPPPGFSNFLDCAAHVLYWRNGAWLEGRSLGGIDEPPEGIWVAITDEVNTPEETGVYAQVSVDCQAGADFEVRFDNASFVETETLFSDGFESAGTSRWSSAVP